MWDSGNKPDVLKSPVGLSEAEYASLPLLECKGSWRTLDALNVSQNFEGLPPGDLDAHTAFVGQIPHKHEYHACYILWKEVGRHEIQISGC